MKKAVCIFLFSLIAMVSQAAYILIPMDLAQKDHLKAYGIAYWVLKHDLEVHWLLNYRGGSFMIKDAKEIENECTIRGVSFEVIADSKSTSILTEISNPEINMEDVKLEKAPKVAVYSPKTKQPWDDAVTLVLTYAEIPYDVIYDEEIIKDKLLTYDWLHLHHEDFTGQYGKFWFPYHNAAWYQEQQRTLESSAHALGFEKVSQMKLAVAKKIRDFTSGGGFLFAMCSAPDSYDIALSAEGIDICENMFDGDGTTPNYNQKLDFSRTFAFTNFKLSTNPNEYSKSNIDNQMRRQKYGINKGNDLFTLFEFSAKWDVVPTMLCQNHEQIIKGFWGQTVAFEKSFIKPDILILGENKAANEARYIHGEYGKGMFTFYSGHDPEDYEHRVEDPPTDLSLHPNSPGYRLILNNILFPAAKKKKQKT
ncbi:MAG TPA: asparagine synthetase B [Bacteroidia bacterium]|nr:asparagine synthetase B [Bacteroidia bacterium]HRG52115.1 asparagine synthetase B [Bacteroidia bacterium]